MKLDKEKILIVGNGVVGSSLIYSINNNKKYEIYLSKYKKGKYIKSQIFNHDIPISSKSSGGLSNLWHSVIDLNIFNKQLEKNTSLMNFLIGSDIQVNSNKEFIPYFPIRPKKLLKNRNYSEALPVKSFKLNDNKVHVTFIDNTNECFDRIFICHGALPEIDCLVNSGYAKKNVLVSDHLVAQLHKTEPALKCKIEHSSKGHCRNYAYYNFNETHIKLTLRPTYKDKPEIISHADKGIYNGNFLKVFFNIVKKFNLTIVKQSLYLRFGINFKSKNWASFIQFNCPDVYINKNNNLTVNKSSLEKTLAIIKDNGFKIDKKSLMSGIHFYNTYSYLSGEVSVNEYNKSKLITLISPGYQFNASAKHFTYELMMLAEKIGQNLCQKH
jgi:hypothetical protein